MSGIGIGATAGVAAGTYQLSANVVVTTNVAGSTFVVSVWQDNGSVGNLTDSLGNTYVLEEGPLPVFYTYQYMSVYVCQNAVGGTNMKVTWNPEQGGYLPMQFYEVYGAIAASLDQAQSGGAPEAQNTVLLTPNVNTQDPVELILGIVGCAFSTLPTLTAANGATYIFTTFDTVNNLGFGSAYQVVTGAGGYNVTIDATQPCYTGAVTLSFIQTSAGPAITYKLYANGAIFANSFIEGTTGLPSNMIMRMANNGTASIPVMVENATSSHMYANGTVQSTQFIE